jgi:hypothetical protein
MKYLLSTIFIFVFSLAVFGQVSNPPGCQFSFAFPDGSSQPFNNAYERISAAGGSLTYRIVGNPTNCTPSFRGSSNTSWLNRFSVAPNTGPARTGTLAFGSLGDNNGGFNLNIYQESGCTYNAIAPSFLIPASGGISAVFKYISDPACGSATEISNDSWLVIDRPGTPTSYLTAAPNTGPARTGTVTVNFSNGDIRILAFNQAGTCSFQISQSSQEFPASGGTGTVTVSGQPGCPYASLNELSYLTLDSGAEGSGSGTVTFTVSPNSGAARTGTIFIAGQDFRINQAAGKSRKRVRFF